MNISYNDLLRASETREGLNTNVQELMKILSSDQFFDTMSLKTPYDYSKFSLVSSTSNRYSFWFVLCQGSIEFFIRSNIVFLKYTINGTPPDIMKLKSLLMELNITSMIVGTKTEDETIEVLKQLFRIWVSTMHVHNEDDIDVLPYGPDIDFNLSTLGYSELDRYNIISDTYYKMKNGTVSINCHDTIRTESEVSNMLTEIKDVLKD